MQAPLTGDQWIGLTAEVLPIASALEWAVVPSCGALNSFVGVVRDHAEGRRDVLAVEYEAFEDRVLDRFEEIALSCRRQWSDLGRLVLLHRTGRLLLGEASILIVASTPHRTEAFEVTRYCIETVKTAVPIWKKEFWAQGTDWGLNAHDIKEVSEDFT